MDPYFELGRLTGGICTSVCCALPFALIGGVVAYFILASKKNEGTSAILIALLVFLAVLVLCSVCAFCGSMLGNVSAY
ncbi:hypothetical protein JW766_05630 [Candidatus Dojkabacteria bacterium]|nr:hypothetical protein [Candidatus Dojkabacteria bacterium]